MANSKNDGQPSMGIDAGDLAKKLVKSLFEIGDEPGLPCQRIAFKCAEKPGFPESEQGGMSQGALIQHFEGEISEFQRGINDLLVKAQDLAEEMRKHNLTHLGQLQLR